MAVTATPVFVQTPFSAELSLAATTLCGTRAPTATASLAAANIIELVGTTTNGVRIDSITVKAASSSMTSVTTAGLVGIWLWDGTTAYLLTEIVITAVTPSTTTPAFETTYFPPQPIVLPSTYKLFASTSVTTTASTNALVVIASGGAY